MPNLWPLLAQAASQTEREIFTHWTWAPWATVLFAVLVIVGIGYLYSRETSPAGRAYRVLLATLRLVAIALVLVMISELMVSTSQTGLPRLVVLLDRSASMNLPAANASNESRLDLARQLLVADQAEWIRQLESRYEIDLRLVGDGTQPIDSLADDQLTGELETLDADEAAARTSRLGDALSAAIDQRGDVLPAAVVLLSDGRTTAGRSLDEARQVARRRGVPVYAVGYGTVDEPADLRIANLLAQTNAFKDDLLAINVTLESTSAAGQTAQLQVRDVAENKIVASKSVEIDTARFSKTVQLVVEPNRSGEITYVVEVAPVADETDLANNRKQHVVTVRDQAVRVLLAAGYPNYEYRYLKNLLDRDRSFELTSYLQEADLDSASQDETTIRQLPLEEDGLDPFEVIVLIDLNPRLLPPRWWQSVERHVVDQGGGLVLVAGPRYFPWAYTNTSSVATLSPIVVGGAGRSGGQTDTGYQPQLTPLAEETTSLQLGPTASDSQTIWRQLPPLYWYVAADTPKPAARVLATHPTARTTTGAPVPLMAEQYVGAGRVLYHGFDSTWRWRFRVGDVYFARYWGQTLRQLARSKALNQQTPLQLVLDRPRYELGQPVRFRMRVDSKQLASLSGGLQVLLTADDQPNRRVTLNPSKAMPEEWQAVLSDLPPGQYRATVADSRLESPPEAVEFQVMTPPGEFADTTMNQTGLEQLAEQTYGKFYMADSSNQLADDLPKAQRVPLETLPPVELWNQWWMLAAITGCLSLEWILRKRRAML
ncbi:vWA domain-containing protein [Aeoliella mucimassa]|uniref:VWFA domain-containing protein n=1 Tax=Aeoliella mucimassa TaxID=2527972 RepID=A0A518AJU7_9BACT|nr:vWA domain-containing protein [Aeoliella mucimassa]QDU55002.1 hypothetical protein Pan181_11870 [Aeoliella mucimassa]